MHLLYLIVQRSDPLIQVRRLLALCHRRSINHARSVTRTVAVVMSKSTCVAICETARAPRSNLPVEVFFSPLIPDEGAETTHFAVAKLLILTTNQHKTATLLLCYSRTNPVALFHFGSAEFFF